MTEYQIYTLIIRIKQHNQHDMWILLLKDKNCFEADAHVNHLV